MPMRGNDRRRHGGRGGGHTANKAEEQADVDESSPVIQAFRGYQRELDTRHDKYERLVKLSRDITIESKRVIFLLQRITGMEATKMLDEAELKFVEIRATKWRKVAEELHNEDPYRFLRAYSPGLQEYVEAVSFWYYQKNNDLVSCQQIQKDLVFPKDVPAEPEVDQPKDDGTNELCDAQEKPDAELIPGTVTPPPLEDATSDTAMTPAAAAPQGGDTPGGDTIAVHVPPIEYMLGVADLTGELMRLAITAVGKGQLDTPARTCAFMRLVHDAFLSYGNVSRELSRKMTTLRQSLGKVENASYMLQVRGSEVPKHMLVDVICAANTGSAFVELDDE